MVLLVFVCSLRSLGSKASQGAVKGRVWEVMLLDLTFSPTGIP